MSYLPDLSYQILTPAMVCKPSPIDKPTSVKSKFKHTYYDEELNKYYNDMIKICDKNKNKIIEYFLIFIAIIYVVVILYAIITY